MNDQTKEVVRQLKALGDCPSWADPTVTPEELMEAMLISGRHSLEQFKREFPKEFEKEFGKEKINYLTTKDG